MILGHDVLTLSPKRWQSTHRFWLLSGMEGDGRTKKAASDIAFNALAVVN